MFSHKLVIDVLASIRNLRAPLFGKRLPEILHSRVVSRLRGRKSCENDVEVSGDAAEEPGEFFKKLCRKSEELFGASTIRRVFLHPVASVIKEFVVTFGDDGTRVLEKGQEVVGFDQKRAKHLVVLGIKRAGEI